MKKKKLKVQVAALAMTGAIAAAPLTVRAEEASAAAPATTSTSSTAASATAAAPAASTATTPAASGTASGASTATASTPATGAATTGTSTTTATAGTGATVTAGTSTATTGTGSGASTGTTATATTETSAPVAATAPVTVAEAPADPSTTVPNHVDTVVPDDNKQGTDIVSKASSILGPIIDVDTSITPEEAKGDGTIGDKNPKVPGILRNIKNKDVVIQGDLSIAKDNSTDFDSTGEAAHEVNKEDSYSLKADLDVNAVNNAINASAKLNGLMKKVNIDTMETGLRSTFEMGRDLEGSFHLPTDLEDAKKHYELSSADGSPMMYRINYANSSFAKDKVSIAMDLDLSQYDRPKEEISTFGALNNLINKSAKKIQLIMKGIKFHAAHGNVEETETATEKTTTAEGTIRGTLVGYMKADVSYSIFAKGNASYVWGAIQSEEGRDFVAGRDRVAGKDNGNNKVDLTVKMTTTESKVKPVEPVQPEEPVKPVEPINPEVPVQPVQPVAPVAPSNGGGRTGVTPATPSRTTTPGTVLGESRPTASTPAGEVLGENRVAPAAEAAEEKKGVVLGESRPSVKGVSDRASVATGDYNFTGLWASLFGISLTSLAGFVVLNKKEQQ